MNNELNLNNIISLSIKNLNQDIYICNINQPRHHRLTTINKTDSLQPLQFQIK
nr:hypothetical protein Itr_chr11CG01320 [Ipomoea trifida]